MIGDFSGASVELRCCDETLLLHPGRVLYWPARKTLFTADIHAGKEHAFARSGIPIPGGISEDTLDLLMQLVDSCGAERLVVLGDLLHTIPSAEESWQAHLYRLLESKAELDLQVIIGNHDSLKARHKIQLPLNWYSDIVEPPFVFRHQPQPDERGYVLAGHIHPVWQLSAGKRNRITAPVFWFQEHIAVLPSFGLFTGGFRVRRQHNDRLFMVGKDCVIEV